MSPLKKLILFLFLTFSFSTVSYIPIIRAGQLGVNGGLYVLTLMYSPGLAAILTQFLATRSLRSMGWRLGAPRFFRIAYLLPIMYALPVYMFTWLTGLGRFAYPHDFYTLGRQLSPHDQPAIVLTLFILLNMTVGMLENMISALGEEIGWRGLLVPELFKLTSFTNTALISGVIWAAWHMPLIFLANYNNTGVPSWYSAACFAIMVIATSFPFAWLRLRSGSLWPAVLLHASHNLFVQAIFDQFTGRTTLSPYLVGEFGIGLALTSIVIAYGLWKTQKSDQVERTPAQILVSQIKESAS